VHGDYDEFWLNKAAKPIEDLIERLPLASLRRVFEAGCGTGYATALLSRELAEPGEVLAVDLSEGMLGEARKRVLEQGLRNVRFLGGDALQLIIKEGPFDLVFSSWVLGYIPLRPFFEAVNQALRTDGLLAFVVHKENSPREALEIFGELVGRDPSVLRKRVAFDFPQGANHVCFELEKAGFEMVEVWENSVTFQYSDAEKVLEHLLKSGAGTAFYDALDPRRRTDLRKEFLEILAARHGFKCDFEVVHDFVASIARKRGGLEVVQ
jgi:SAM-dependent methyltransferase